MATLSLEHGRYLWRGTFAENTYPKEAKLRWDPAAKAWWTDDTNKAARLAAFADASCKDTLEAVLQAQEETREASRATDAPIDIPAPAGLSYLPFQRAGIRFAMEHEATLIGDEMGLGKTIQAIGVINGDPDTKRVLVVCPAHLRLNWKRELEKWLVRPFTVVLASAKSWPATEIAMGRNDSFVVVAHYEAITKHALVARGVKWDLLVVDEAHYIKNNKAKRAQAIVGLMKRHGTTYTTNADGTRGHTWETVLTPLAARRRILMSGTPIANRPVELWSLIHYLDPAKWRSFYQYALRYCDAQQGSFGLDTSGASNLDELQVELRSSIMVRRLKKDVLTELPPKVRQIIEIPANGASTAVEAESEAWDRQATTLDRLRVQVELAKADENEDAYAVAVSKLNEQIRVAITEISALRRATAVAKVPAVIEHIKGLLEERDKVVVFAHHHDVVDGIVNALRPDVQVVVATGRETVEDRTEAVARFQTDDSVQVMVASIMGAGTGFTMTAASLVVFAELDWTPGNVSQAEDRCHRIGQTDSVLVQHLVLDGSLDARMAHVLVDKQNVIDTALDTATEHDRRIKKTESQAAIYPSAKGCHNRRRGAGTAHEYKYCGWCQLQRRIADGRGVDVSLLVHLGRRYAKHRAIEWAITTAELRALRSAGCTYCDGSLSIWSPSLDRIDNTIGYVIGNVVPACGKCNVDRGRLTWDEWWLVVCYRRGGTAATT